MINPFLRDKNFAKPFEQWFAAQYGGTWNETNGNDGGVDFWDRRGVAYDVKCYRPPLAINHFNGVFIETRDGKNPGWIIRDDGTERYLLVVDAIWDDGNYEYLPHPKYWRLYEISKIELQALTYAFASTERIIMDGNKPVRGKILNYQYLEKYRVD